jgi:hypothetical protein
MQSPILAWTLRRISDRDKREGECVIPGEIWWFALVLPSSRGEGMSHQKSAAAILCAEQRIVQEG